MSVRSTPSSVVIFSPSAASRTTMPAPGEPAEVERVQRPAAFEHHVVGDVDDVADRAHARERSRRCIHSGDSPIVTLATIATKRGHRSGASTTTRLAPIASTIGDGLRARERERQAEVRGELAGDADDAHRVGAVRRDREVEHDVVETEHLAHVGAERRVGRRARGCRRGRRRGRARAAEHNMPSDTTPRILRRSILKSPGSTAPTCANGTTMPGSMFGAPQTTRSWPSPKSTSASRMRSASGCGTTSRILRDDHAVDLAAGLVDRLRPRGRAGSARRRCRPVGASTGVNSRIQESGRARRTSELPRRSARRRPRGSSRGRRRRGAGRGGRCRSRTRTRCTPRDRCRPRGTRWGRPCPRRRARPSRSRAHGAAGAFAEHARHRELDRRLGEREERRQEAGADVRAEQRVDERLDGAEQIAERDALVDGEPLDLVEHRRVARRRACRAGTRGRARRRRSAAAATPSRAPAPATCACAAAPAPARRACT